MKILHICLGGGWSENNAYQDQLLPRYHRRLGHEVTIIASYYGKWDMRTNTYELIKEKERLLSDGIKLIRVKPLLPQILNTHVHLFSGLRRYVEKEQPDFIFIHDVESPNYIFARKYKIKHPSVKIVCDNHSDFVNSQHHWTTKLWTRIIVKNFIVQRLIPVVEFFYGTTPIRCEYLKQVYLVPQEKVKLLVMGADDDNLFFEKRDKIASSIRGKYGVQSDDFLIVTGGRINGQKSKAFLSIAEAISKINVQKIKLLVFGPLTDEVKSQFDLFPKERVLLVGQVPSNRVYDYFFAADFVIFPGLHSVLWEQAVASKVPCAFNYIRGFDHVNINGNCVLMSDNTVKYYKGLIEKVFNDKDYYNKLNEAAHSDECDQFWYSHIAQKVLADCFN